LRTCVTGATGFVGGHVTRELIGRGHEVRVILDRAAMRRAVRGCDVVFHTAGVVASKPVSYIQDVNALAPRIAVEAAAAEGVRRVVLTSTVGAIGTAPGDEVADEDLLYRSIGPAAYGDSKHEGEAEALAAGARLGVEVLATNPAYVLGVPLDRSQPGETSTRTVANYLLGRLPAIVDGATNVVDVEDVAKGHLLAAERGEPGERYILGGYNLTWVELVDRLAKLSGVHHPILVLPREVETLARVQEDLGIPSPIAPEAFVLMAQNWRYSSRKARRELGYRARPLEQTLENTVEWYSELIARGRLDSRGASTMSLASVGMRAAGRLGLVAGLRAAERYVGRRLVAGA
jgi:dihydroflavonol-4-reductase